MRVRPAPGRIRVPTGSPRRARPRRLLGMRIAHATAATAAAALLTLLGTVPPATATRPPAPIAWGSCPDSTADTRQQCATLAVPLDHADPTGPQLALAVSRITAARPDQRRGAL